MSHPIEAGNYYIVHPTFDLYVDLDKSPDNGDLSGAQVVGNKSNEESKTQKWYIEVAGGTLPNTYTIRSESSETAYLAPVAPYPGSKIQVSATSFPWTFTPAKGGSYKITPGNIPFEGRAWTLSTGQEGETVALRPGASTTWNVTFAKDDDGYDSD